MVAVAAASVVSGCSTGSNDATGSSLELAPGEAACELTWGDEPEQLLGPVSFLGGELGTDSVFTVANHIEVMLTYTPSTLLVGFEDFSISQGNIVVPGLVDPEIGVTFSRSAVEGYPDSSITCWVNHIEM